MSNLQSRIGFFLIIFGTALLVTACGSQEKSAPNHSTPATRPVQEVTMDNGVDLTPTSIEGIYRADGFWVSVKAGTITIRLVGGGYSGLYWKGTAPDNNVGTFTSQGDVGLLASSIVGSQASSKVFHTTDHSISFEFSALGATRTVEATR